MDSSSYLDLGSVVSDECFPGSATTQTIPGITSQFYEVAFQVMQLVVVYAMWVCLDNIE
jgi:hypothetical protein